MKEKKKNTFILTEAIISGRCCKNELDHCPFFLGPGVNFERSSQLYNEHLDSFDIFIRL